MDPLLLIILILLPLCFVALSWFAGSDAPFVTTFSFKINPILKTAGVKKGTVFYELGSGDGRVVLAAAQIGARSTGIEQSWLRVWYSRYKARKLKLSNADFIHGNVFTRAYYPADVVYIYLLQSAVEKLEKKLQTELKPGAIVITQSFHFKNWPPFKKIEPTEEEKRTYQKSKNNKAGSFWFYRKS
jgi:SAM-dependent methyltransferase